MPPRSSFTNVSGLGLGIWHVLGIGLRVLTKIGIVLGLGFGLIFMVLIKHVFQGEVVIRMEILLRACIPNIDSALQSLPTFRNINLLDDSRPSAA